LRNLAISLQHALVKHHIAISVDNVALLIHKVATDVYKTAFAVDVTVTAWSFLEDRGTLLVDVDFTLDSLDVEFSVGENLDELARFEVCLLPQDSSVDINDVTLLINEVSLFVDEAAEVVEQVVTALLGLDVAIRVLIKLAHYILDVEALTTVIEQLVQVFASQLTLVELLTSVFVDDVTLVRESVPPVTVDTPCFLIDVESLGCFHQDWLAILVVKVAHKVVGVEVMFLKAEGSRDITALVKVLCWEHRLVG